MISSFFQARRWISGLLVLAVMAAPAVQAHEFWFVPIGTPQPVGETVALRLEVGEFFEGDAAGFSMSRSTAMRHYTTGKQHDLRPYLSPEEPEAEVLLALNAPGIHMVSFDSAPRHITLSADKFQAYLHDEGLDSVKAQREKAGTAEQPGRERYWRNVKTLIQVGPPAPLTASGQATDRTYAIPTAQRLEITPLNNPLALPVGTALRLQIAFDAKPLAGALVKAWHKRNGQVLSIRTRTSVDGKAEFHLPYPGGWMVSVVHMVPAVGDVDADWDSYWGNLSFSVAQP